MYATLHFGNRSPVPGSGQLVQGGPALAGRAYILTLIAADRAYSGWLIGVGLLYGAGTTDKDGQNAFLPWGSV